MIFHGQQALDIAQGTDRNGLTQINLIGRNTDIDIGTEDIWDGGGDYNQFAAAALVHVSSSNNGDTQTLTIVGLNASGVLQTKTVDLVGQTETAIAADPTWIAIISVSISAAPTGDVYVYENDTITAGVPDTATKIRAKILAGNLRAYMASYMIPTGYSGFLMEYGGSHSGLQLWKIPALGGVAEWVENLNGYRQAPLYLPAGTFIKLRYTATADNQDVRATAVLILRKAQ